MRTRMRNNAAAIIAISNCCSLASAFTGIGRPPALHQQRHLPQSLTTTARGTFSDTNAKATTRLHADATDADGAVTLADLAADIPNDVDDDDVKIVSASVLPPVPPAALVEVYYAEQSIAALGMMAEVVEANHAGMTFKIANYAELVASGEITDTELVPEEFTVEWYAENFPFGAFLPQVIKSEDATADDSPSVSKTGLQWENESWAFYSPVFKPDRWSKGRTLIGTVGGSAIRKYGQWVVDYCTNSPGYDAFEVWDRPYLESGVTRRWASSCTCSSFTQGSMTTLYELGKAQKLGDNMVGVNLDENMSGHKEMIMRSYVPLISKSIPTVADLTDPKQAQDVREFYIELRKAVGDGGGLTTSQFIRLLANKLETFYVYRTAEDAYYRVNLDAPYFAVASLYQPLSLPWQRLDLEGDGEMQDPAAFAEDFRENENFAVELGRAAKGIVDLAKRRVPPVLKKKLRQKLTDEGVLGGALVAGASGLGIYLVASTFQLIDIDATFISGVAVGVAGAKLLL